MTIAKNNKNFLESEIMRSLEKVAIKKGLVKADDLEKTASVKEDKVKLELTNDLHHNLISLAVELKNKGYEKEYSDLIDCIFIHKQAETHLYRAFDEDGEDLLDFAHPEGDAQVAPGEYGIVETLSSAQKKTIDKVNKTPTGKYAAIDPVVSMSLVFGEAMGPLLEMDSGDIADIVIKPLVRAVRQDFKGSLSDLNKIANLFDRLMKADASDWANHIKNERSKIPNYDMNQALGIVAENAWVRAHVRYQNQMRNGVFASEVQKVIKKGQDSGQSWIDNNFTVSLIIQDLIIKLYGDDVGELIWFGKDPALYDDDANRIIAQEILTSAKLLLEDYLKSNIDPSKTWELLSTMMLNKKMDGTWYATRWHGKNVLDVGRLYFAVSSFLFKNKDKYTPKSKPEEKQITSNSEIRKYFIQELKALSNLLEKLESIRSRPDITKENEENAYKIQTILSDIKTSIETASSFYDLKGKLKNSVTSSEDWYGIKDLANVKSLINKAIIDAKAWIPYLEKNASLKEKQAFIPPPPSDKSEQPAGSAYPAPGQGQSRSNVINIQTELGNIADILDKNRLAAPEFTKTLKEIGSAASPTTPDGVWGGKTVAAIDGLNKHIVPNLEGATSIPKTPTADTAAALQKLKENLKNIKGKSNELGSYKDIPIKIKDLLSPWHLYQWAVDNREQKYQQDKFGIQYLNLKDFANLVDEMGMIAQAEIEMAKNQEDRRKKMIFAQKLGNILGAIRDIAVYKANTAEDKNSFYAEPIIRVDELKPSKAVAPGAPGTLGSKQRGPQITQDGTLGDGFQVSWIEGSNINIPEGSPAEWVPPIAAVLDLADMRYNLPEKFRMDYYSWRRADAASLARNYFGAVAAQNLQEFQRTQENLQQHSLMLFMNFLTRLQTEISRVFNEWQEDLVDQNLRSKLVTPAEQQAFKWNSLILNKYQKAQEALRSLSYPNRR